MDRGSFIPRLSPYAYCNQWRAGQGLETGLRRTDIHTQSCYLTDVSKAVAFNIQRIISDLYLCSNSSREVYRPYVTSQLAFVYA